MANHERMRLLAWKAVRRGMLRGFATIELPIGLRMYDVAIFSKDGEPRAVMPEKPKLNRDGQQLRRSDGKPAYERILEWKSRRLADAFSVRVVELLRAGGHSLDVDNEAAE